MANDSKQIQITQEVATNTGTVIGVQYRGLSPEEVQQFLQELKHEDQPMVWNGRFPYHGRYSND